MSTFIHVSNIKGINTVKVHEKREKKTNNIKHKRYTDKQQKS